MNTEEKILAILEKHSEMFAQVFSRMDQMQETQERMQKAQEQLQGTQERMQKAQEQMQKAQEQMQKAQEQLQGTQEQMQGTLTRVALTQENIVLKSLDALAEGQDLTHQRLKDLAGKDELADLREEVRLLRTVVAQNTQDIEAMKAAQ